MKGDKTYRVKGDRNVLGWEPGDEFSQPIPEEQERRLIERGQLEVVGEEVFTEADELNNGGNEPGVGDPEAGQEN